MHANDYLIAAFELAEQAQRDEHGFLTEEGRKAVQAAYAMVDRAQAGETGDKAWGPRKEGHWDANDLTEAQARTHEKVSKKTEDGGIPWRDPAKIGKTTNDHIEDDADTGEKSTEPFPPDRSVMIDEDKEDIDGAHASARRTARLRGQNPPSSQRAGRVSGTTRLSQAEKAEQQEAEDHDRIHGPDLRDPEDDGKALPRPGPVETEKQTIDAANREMRQFGSRIRGQMVTLPQVESSHETLDGRPLEQAAPPKRPAKIKSIRLKYRQKATDRMGRLRNIWRDYQQAQAPVADGVSPKEDDQWRKTRKETARKLARENASISGAAYEAGKERSEAAFQDEADIGPEEKTMRVSEQDNKAIPNSARREINKIRDDNFAEYDARVPAYQQHIADGGGFRKISSDTHKQSDASDNRVFEIRKRYRKKAIDKVVAANARDRARLLTSDGAVPGSAANAAADEVNSAYYRGFLNPANEADTLNAAGRSIPNLARSRVRRESKAVDKVAAANARDAARRVTARGGAPDEANWAAWGHTASDELTGFLNPGNKLDTRQAVDRSIPGLARVREEAREDIRRMEEGKTMPWREQQDNLHNNSRDETMEEHHNQLMTEYAKVDEGHQLPYITRDRRTAIPPRPGAMHDKAVDPIADMREDARQGDPDAARALRAHLESSEPEEPETGTTEKVDVSGKPFSVYHPQGRTSTGRLHNWNSSPSNTTHYSVDPTTPPPGNKAATAARTSSRFAGRVPLALRGRVPHSRFRPKVPSQQIGRPV